MIKSRATAILKAAENNMKQPELKIKIDLSKRKTKTNNSAAANSSPVKTKQTPAFKVAIPAIKEEAHFYELSYGDSTGKIPNTYGSLLKLPNTNGKQIVATSAPSKKASALVFWRDLVFAQDTPLIVNLCGDVSSNEHDYWKECYQYWPANANQ